MIDESTERSIENAEDERVRAAYARRRQTIPAGRYARTNPFTLCAAHEREEEMAAMFSRLSTRSRYLRFMSPIRTVSASMLAYLAAIDHQRHEAVGAFDDRVLVGAAHYFRSATDPTSAEIAAEVTDPYQGMGIGRRLMCELGRIARERGITRFDARTFFENKAAVSWVRNSGWRAATTLDGPELEISVEIPAALP